MARIARLLLVRYAGAGRAALYLAGLSTVRKALRSKEVAETLTLRPGERYVVEHLEISHKGQIKELKRAEKQAKRDRRAARKAARRTAS